MNEEVISFHPVLGYHPLLSINGIASIIIVDNFKQWGDIMLEGWFLWFILFWMGLLILLMVIGGFFMFRKFFKRLPKQDGKSNQDWEDFFVKQTRDLWPIEQKALLEDLVSPVPELFRDVARQKIAGKIGEIALKEKVNEITEELVIRGYIMATPKRDHKYLRKKLLERKVNMNLYEHLFES